MKENKPRSRRDNIVVQKLDGELLIYDLNESKAFCLNQTSAMVWQSCDGKKTIAEISDQVGKQLNSQINEDIVWLALDQLGKENLIENQIEINNKFAGLSRREVIKKVGLASIIALPMVSSLVAPPAVHANSACVPGGGCQCSTPNNSPGATPICATSVACTDNNCRCQRANSGNNTNGNCVP